MFNLLHYHQHAISQVKSNSKGRNFVYIMLVQHMVSTLKTIPIIYKRPPAISRHSENHP